MNTQLEKELIRLQKILSPLSKFVEKESSSFFKSIRIHVRLKNLMIIPKPSYSILLWEIEVYFSRAFGLLKRRVCDIQVELTTNDNSAEGKLRFSRGYILAKFNEKIAQESLLAGSYESAAPYRLGKTAENIFYKGKLLPKLREYKSIISHEFNIPLTKIDVHD